MDINIPTYIFMQISLFRIQLQKTRSRKRLKRFGEACSNVFVIKLPIFLFYYLHVSWDKNLHNLDPLAPKINELSALQQPYPVFQYNLRKQTKEVV